RRGAGGRRLPLLLRPALQPHGARRAGHGPRRRHALRHGRSLPQRRRGGLGRPDADLPKVCGGKADLGGVGFRWPRASRSRNTPWFVEEAQTVLKGILAAFTLAAGLGAGVSALAQVAAAPPAETHNDYANPANWLFRPNRQDACTVNLDATVIRADGSTTIERFHPDPDAPIDCFYVYPTVSLDPGVNATMAIEPSEQVVVQQQFARLGAKCRLFAPMYRQHTLTALAAGVS